MASHRAPKVASRATAVSVVGVAAGAAVAMIPGTSQAAPAPTLSQVRSEVQQLNTQSDVATQAYDAAETTYTNLQQKVAALQNQITQDQKDLQALQSSMGLQAAAQYQDGGISPSLQLLLTSSPDAFLSDASVSSQAQSIEALRLKMIAQDKAQLKSEAANANALQAQAATALNQAKTNKDQIQATLAQKQQLLSTLTVQQVAQVTTTGGTTFSGTLPPASGRAAAAIAYARSKIGDPYVYGAAGPNAFDCSGLVMSSWAAAGVSLPRTSEEMGSDGNGFGGQYTAITVFYSASQLQPGDIIFFEGAPPYSGHVALYIGNGMFIQAASTGIPVEYSSLDPNSPYYAYMTPTGFGRVNAG